MGENKGVCICKEDNSIFVKDGGEDILAEKDNAISQLLAEIEFLKSGKCNLYFINIRKTVNK